MITENGITLIGEAAKSYVTFKYFETVFLAIIICATGLGIGWLILKVFKMAKDN